MSAIDLVERLELQRIFHEQGGETNSAEMCANARDTITRLRAALTGAFEKAAEVADYAVERAERDWRDPAKQEAVKQVGAEIAEVIREYARSSVGGE